MEKATVSQQASVVKPQDAAEFVAGLMAVPVRDAVVSAATSLRLRLARSLELTQSMAIMLDQAASFVETQASQLVDAQQVAEDLRATHATELEAARADQTTQSELKAQAEEVGEPPSTALPHHTTRHAFSHSSR